MTNNVRLADMLRTVQEHDYNEPRLTFSRVFVAELEDALRASSNVDERTKALENALRKLRDAAAVSQTNANQVGCGPEYAEATRLLDDSSDISPLPQEKP